MNKIQFYRKKIFTRQLLAIYVMIFLYQFVFQMIMTPMTSFGLSLGISGVVLGVISNLYEFSCMAARNVAGTLVDDGKYRKTIAIGFLVICVNAVLFLLVRSRVGYGLVRFLTGFTAGYTGAAFTALLPSVMEPGLVGSATAIYSILASLGASYAPKLSAGIFTTYGYPHAYAAAAVLSSVCLLLSLWGIPANIQKADVSSDKAQNAETEEADEGKPAWLRGLSAKVIPACMIGLLVNITKDLNSFYTVQLGLDKGIDVTTGIAIAGTLSIGVLLLTGILIDHGFVKKVMLICLSFLVISNILYGSANSAGMATAAAVFYKIGIGGYWPCLITFCCQLLPGRQGAAIATLYFFMDVVSLVNNVLLGYLYDTLGSSHMYYVVGIVNAAAIVYYLIWLNRRKLSVRKL